MQKILLLLLSQLLACGILLAQDGIIGAGFGTNDWVTIDNFGGSAGGSLIFTATPNGTGNQYFRVSSFGTQQSPSATCTGGEDQLCAANTVYTAGNTNCTNGAWYFNCPNTTDNYVFKTQGAGTNQFITFQVQGAIESVINVAQNPVVVPAAQDVTITATVSGTGALPTGQGVYLRYTTDGFASSSVIEMTYSGTGQDYTAVIPGLFHSPSTTVNYYVFTSGDGLAITHNTADWYTINLNNNGGPNYSYSIAASAPWTTRAGGDGSWDDPNMWDNLAVPPAGVDVIIEDDIVLDMDATVNSITINAGINFTASDASPRTLSLLQNGTLTNNGNYIRNVETIYFLKDGTINGTVSANNIQTGGGIDPGTATTVNGILTILTGGFVLNNPFSYATGSTLLFNTGADFNLNAANLEWNATVTPHHLEIANGTVLNAFDDITRIVNGNFTVNGGRFNWAHTASNPADLIINGNLLITGIGELTILDGDGDNLNSYNLFVNGDFTVDASSRFMMNNDIGDDLTIAGDVTNNGELNSNNRLVILSGPAPQFLSGTFTGNSRFHYLETNNAFGITLNNDVLVEDELRMTVGHIYPTSNDLIIDVNGSIIGAANSGTMVVATGTGTLTKRFDAVGNFTFPVGDVTGTPEYSPVDLTINTATLGANAQIAVNLEDIKHPGNPSPNHFLTRYWNVVPTDISTIDYDINFLYTDSDVVGTESSILELKSNDGGASWTDLGNVDVVLNRIILPAQTSFSIFTGGDVVALPVDLVKFEGTVQGQQTELFWQTASEINSDYFEVEHLSAKGEWQVIARQQAAGNSSITSNYEALHLSPHAGINYYRLIQFDEDGTSTRYQTIAVQFDQLEKISWHIDQNDQIQLFFTQNYSGELQLNLFDIQGRLLTQKNYSLNQNRQLTFTPTNSLSSQVYYLQVKGLNTETQTLKITKN